MIIVSHTRRGSSFGTSTRTLIMVLFSSGCMDVSIRRQFPGIPQLIEYFLIMIGWPGQQYIHLQQLNLYSSFLRYCILAFWTIGNLLVTNFLFLQCKPADCNHMLSSFRSKPKIQSIISLVYHS